MPIDQTPSRNEDEYFLKLDAELIKEMRARLDADRARVERKSHYMRCPKCGGTLGERDFEHVKVDVCAECRGIWFDAGEIEMLGHVKNHHAANFFSNLFRGFGAK